MSLTRRRCRKSLISSSTLASLNGGSGQCFSQKNALSERQKRALAHIDRYQNAFFVCDRWLQPVKLQAAWLLVHLTRTAQALTKWLRAQVIMIVTNQTKQDTAEQILECFDLDELEVTHGLKLANADAAGFMFLDKQHGVCFDVRVCSVQECMDFRGSIDMLGVLHAEFCITDVRFLNRIVEPMAKEVSSHKQICVIYCVTLREHAEFAASFFRGEFSQLHYDPDFTGVKNNGYTIMDLCRIAVRSIDSEFVDRCTDYFLKRSAKSAAASGKKKPATIRKERPEKQIFDISGSTSRETRAQTLSSDTVRQLLTSPRSEVVQDRLAVASQIARALSQGAQLKKQQETELQRIDGQNGPTNPRPAYQAPVPPKKRGFSNRLKRKELHMRANTRKASNFETCRIENIAAAVAAQPDNRNIIYISSDENEEEEEGFKDCEETTGNGCASTRSRVSTEESVNCQRSVSLTALPLVSISIESSPTDSPR